MSKPIRIAHERRLCARRCRSAARRHVDRRRRLAAAAAAAAAAADVLGEHRAPPLQKRSRGAAFAVQLTFRIDKRVNYKLQNALVA